jgi:hypothetical protein
MLGVQSSADARPGMHRLCRDPGPLDARWGFAAVRALYVFRELLFELGPPAGPSAGAGPAHSSAPATLTAAEARVIVLIRAPRRRSRPYHQPRQQQRQAERNDQRQDDRVIRANRGLVRLGQDGLELLSTDSCRLMSRSGRSRGAPNRLGVAELADLERPHDVDGARHHRPDADEHEQCVGARQEELPAHPEAQRHHEDATDQGQPP